MELQERVSILVEAAQLAQKGGALTLDDAYIAKQAVDICKKGGDLKLALDALTSIANIGQRKGVYTLRDAHFIYTAIDNLASFFTPAPEPTATEEPVAKTKKK